jgi:hypothetical protein
VDSIARDRNFFSRFKERVQLGSGRDPGGRYFAILLEQVFYEIPDILPAVVFRLPRNRRFRATQAITEYYFLPGKRAADLAFLDANGNVLGLVEVKEEDQLTKRNTDQTRDYLSFVKKGRRQFSYVTKHLPAQASQKLLLSSKMMPTFYSDLYAGIKNALAQDRWDRCPVARMFCAYIEKQGVMYMDDDIDDYVLGLLLQQGNSGIRRAVSGQKVTAERLSQTPQLLATLMSNVEALGIEFHNKYRSLLGNRFSPRFAFYPMWNTEEVRDRLVEYTKPETPRADRYEKLSCLAPRLLQGW